MTCKKTTALFLFGLLGSLLLRAQRVTYSPVLSSRATGAFEVVGRTGSFYWVHKSTRAKGAGKSSRRENKEPGFLVYDARLNLVAEIPYELPDTVHKQYFIAGKEYFDQLQLTAGGNQMNVLVNRYPEKGNFTAHRMALQPLPGHLQANDVLLLRSPDKTRILLLAFEAADSLPPQVHAFLYNNDWKLLSQAIYKDPNLTQPFIQYDFQNFPLEHFDHCPIQLANNGDWLMLVPSRRNQHYVLLHFSGADSSFVQKEIKLPKNPRVQNVCLSLDREEAYAGILLSGNRSPLHKVRIARYLLPQLRFDFDTLYQFQPMAAQKRGEEHLFEQDFISIPGKGFVFLKEYGRQYTPPTPIEEKSPDDTEDGPPALPASPAETVFNKNDYTRYPHLAAARKAFERGDLSLYFFPAARQDSCWSGIINKAQTTELNSSYLSYACLPLEGKMIFLYNNLSFSNKSGSTFFLDGNGSLMNEDLVFWRSNHVLDFQKARQIGARELAIPYERNRVRGFAIIRL